MPKKPSSRKKTARKKTARKTTTRKVAAKFETELMAIDSLKPHPRNYRAHPDDQLEHIVRSIEQHGFYRNVVVAKDNTILAGHGVVLALEKMKQTMVPVHRIPIAPNSSQALKVLTGDNELDHLAIIDDRALTELLKEIQNADKLLGTGFDEQMLAALVFNTRDAKEINSFDEAAHWVGMPEYEPSPSMRDRNQITISFETMADRHAFAKKLDIEITDMTRGTWYPQKDREDRSSLAFEKK